MPHPKAHEGLRAGRGGCGRLTPHGDCVAQVIDRPLQCVKAADDEQLVR